MTSGHTNSHSNSYSNSHSNSYSNSYGNSHSNSHANSHTNHSNHSNTVAASGSFPTTNNHSVSIGSTSITGLTGRLGYYSGSASLKQLLTAAEEARNSISNPNTSTIPSLNQKAADSVVTGIYNYIGGTHTLYNYSSAGVNMDITTAITGNFPDGRSTGSSHASTGGTLTNTQASAIASTNVHSNSGGASYHANTSGTLFQNPAYNKSFPSSQPGMTQGNKILQSNLNSILAVINSNKVLSSSLSPFTYTASGNNKYTYSNSYSNSHGNSHRNSHTNSHSSSHTNSHSNSYSNSGTNSSIKYKEKVETWVGNALNILKDVRVVGFNYKPDMGEDPDIRHVGFIAEDTSEILSTKYHDRMDYINCIGLLIKAVQELNDKINKLTEQKWEHSI